MPAKPLGLSVWPPASFWGFSRENPVQDVVKGWFYPCELALLGLVSAGRPHEPIGIVPKQSLQVPSRRNILPLLAGSWPAPHAARRFLFTPIVHPSRPAWRMSRRTMAEMLIPLSLASFFAMSTSSWAVMRDWTWNGYRGMCYMIAEIRHMAMHVA